MMLKICWKRLNIQPANCGMRLQPGISKRTFATVRKILLLKRYCPVFCIA